MRVLRVAAVLVLASLAGCNDDQASASPDDVVPEGAFDEGDAEATKDTGVIRGVVVDEAITPLEDANVIVRVTGGEPLSATAKKTGGFDDEGLEPATYFLKATKPGYQPPQVSVDVVAGVSDPKAVKILLSADAGLVPFLEEYKLDGFTQCGGFVLILTFWAACSFLVEDNNAPGATYEIQPNTTWFQSEMIWEPNFPTSDSYWLAWDTGGVSGTSPLILMMNGTAMGEVGEKGGETGFTEIG